MNQTIAINSFRAWLLASRPMTLGAITFPVLLGSAMAFCKGSLKPDIFLLTLLCALVLQILANVLNDFGDFKRGSDTSDRLGPPRAMQMGYLDEQHVKTGAGLLLFIAILMGIWLILHAGWPVIMLGGLGIFLCGFYTLGPKPLAYLGFAEVVIFFIFGPVVVMGSYFVQTLSFSSAVLVSSLSPGFLSSALLLLNNTRDHDEDKKNHKQTTAVRLGQKTSRYLILSLLLLSALGPICLVFIFSFHPILLLSLFSLVPAIKRVPIIFLQPASKRYNLVLKAIGMSNYLFSVLMSLGVIYGAP